MDARAIDLKLTDGGFPLFYEGPTIKREAEDELVNDMRGFQNPNGTPPPVINLEDDEHLFQSPSTLKHTASPTKTNSSMTSSTQDTYITSGNASFVSHFSSATIPSTTGAPQRTEKREDKEDESQDPEIEQRDCAPLAEVKARIRDQIIGSIQLGLSIGLTNDEMVAVVTEAIKTALPDCVVEDDNEEDWEDGGEDGGEGGGMDEGEFEGDGT